MGLEHSDVSAAVHLLDSFLRAVSPSGKSSVAFVLCTPASDHGYSPDGATGKIVARAGGLTSAIGIQRVRGEDRQAYHRENGCGCFDHCCCSRCPIVARNRVHDCVQIRSKINCMLAIPCLLQPNDIQPCVSGCFRGPRKTVSSRKNTPPVSKYVVPAALDPNRATEMPSELAGAMRMPVFPGGMI